jgi:hypothetical protein
MGGLEALGVGLLHLGGGVGVFFDVVFGEEAAEDLLDYADDAVHCMLCMCMCIFVCMCVYVCVCVCMCGML